MTKEELKVKVAKQLSIIDDANNEICSYVNDYIESLPYKVGDKVSCSRCDVCWIALGVISAYLLAIVGKIIFDAATADYKLYKHVRLCRKRLLRQRYEDYAWLLLQLEKDTEVFNLTHNTRDWTFEDWREFYLKKAKEDKQ